MNVGADSWYSRPIFYSGGGAGYSGRPEVEDTMYLYFPSKNEEDLWKKIKFVESRYMGKFFEYKKQARYIFGF